MALISGIVGRQIEPPEDHVPPRRRLKRAVGEMEPVEKLREVGMVRRQHQPALAVTGDDVFDDGPRFGQQHVAVLDHRRRAEWVQGLVFRRGEPRDGVPVIDLELIGDAEFLAEPDDPLGLRHAEMMDGEHGASQGLGNIPTGVRAVTPARAGCQRSPPAL